MAWHGEIMLAVCIFANIDLIRVIEKPQEVFFLIIHFYRGISRFWGMLQLSRSLEGVGQSNTEDTGDYYSRKYIVAFTGKLFSGRCFEALS